MSHLRRSSLLAGLFLSLLVVVSISLPYDAFDWTAFSQPYGPTDTPTTTATLTPTNTATSVATATATVTPTSTISPTPSPTGTPEFFSYLPLIRRSVLPVSGSMLIEDGACCVGGTAGNTIEIDVAFDASSPFGDVTEMRARDWGGGCLTEEELSQAVWEPFMSSKVYPVTLAINWVGFYVSVQYRDINENLSPVYCDDISVEGMPAPTPQVDG